MWFLHLASLTIFDPRAATAEERRFYLFQHQLELGTLLLICISAGASAALSRSPLLIGATQVRRVGSCWCCCSRCNPAIWLVHHVLCVSNMSSLVFWQLFPVPTLPVLFVVKIINNITFEKNYIAVVAAVILMPMHLCKIFAFNSTKEYS